MTEINKQIYALDLLALALVNHDHQWTDEEREAYEQATDRAPVDDEHWKRLIEEVKRLRLTNANP